MFDWLLRPNPQKASARRIRRRRAAVRLLPSAPSRTGGGTQADPFKLYPCTRLHGADFDAEFNAVDELSYI
jgi:hypothetical protein